MPQMTKMKKQIQEAKKLHLSWRARLIIFMVIAPATFLLALYGRLELGWPLIISFGMLGLVIWLKWALRRHAWFWGTMAAIAILHLALIIFIPWPATWVPALLMTVISTVDFFLILWVLVIVERRAGQSQHDGSTGRNP